MKRGHLMTGIVYVAVGILLLALSSLTEGRLGSLLFAFGFAGAVPGAVMIGKYVYWTSPRNRERYAERVEQERIDLQDELNQKLFTGRDPGMIQYAADYLSQPGSHTGLLVVGAGHMVGDTGVVQGLRDLGYTVELVPVP